MSDPVRILVGDCLEAMRGMDAASVDAIVTDPPYGLSFMGKHWDHGVPGVDFWVEALRVAKPGTHLLAFGGTRTYHRLACAIEDAGWEVRDCIAWVYGSGFPKSLDVSKAIDATIRLGGSNTRRLRQTEQETGGDSYVLNGKNNGILGESKKWDRKEWFPTTDPARQWSGWGTALKPAFEPIIVARKPLIGTVAANVQEWGTGAINVDGCRVGTEGESFRAPQSDPSKRHGEVGTDLGISRSSVEAFQAAQRASIERTAALGRWPANLIHDGSDEVVALFPQAGGSTAGTIRNGVGVLKHDGQNSRPQHADSGGETVRPGYADSGSAARFFYCAKASKSERWDYLSCDCEAPIFPAWESEGRSRSARTVYTSPARDTCAGSSTADSSSLTLPLGNAFTDACPEDTKSITSTMTSRTTASKTCGSSVPPSTSAFIPGASCAATNGGSRVEYAASSSPSTRGIGTSPERDGPSMGVAVPATSLRSSETSNCGNCGKPFRRVCHPTVKPTDLMRYLCRLVTPPGGIVLDPFAGSGSTGKGAVLEGFNFIGIELDAEYAEIARARIGNATSADKGLFA